MSLAALLSRLDSLERRFEALGQQYLGARQQIRQLQQRPLENGAPSLTGVATVSPDIIAIARVTTIITPRSGAVCGVGAGIIQVITGLTLSDGTGDPEVIRNMTDFTISAGLGANDYILVCPSLGTWWAVVPSSCSELS